MATPSIFNTTSPQTTATTAPTENTTTETSTTDDTPETENTTETTDESTSAPTAPVVRLTDGTEVPADQYVQQQLAEEKASLNSEWDKVRQAEIARLERETATPTTQPTTQTEETTKWNVPKVNIDDPDAFQSDVEKSLATTQNQLGDTVAEIGNTLSKEVQEARQELNSKTEELDKEIQDAKAEREALRAQRQIDTIERTKGITEAELTSVYNEFNGTIGDMNALAEIVELRKGREAASEERTQEATEQRREAVSNVSGGANAQTTAGEDQPKGRGLEGKDRYSGAAIAAKYRAFN